MWAARNAFLTGVASSPLVATGGTVTDVAGYRYHTFTSSDTFTLNYASGIDIEYLVVGGGGGGGYYVGGGGGGGAVAVGSLTVTDLFTSVTVGEAGLGVYSNAGTTGGTSRFEGTDALLGAVEVIALGGGGGGTGHAAINATSGGSGGGGGAVSQAGQANGPNTNPGGSGGGGATFGGAGGGGGAGAAGAARSGANGGAGGLGLDPADFGFTIPGHAYIAAGGGGGAGAYGNQASIGGPGAGNGGTNGIAATNATTYGSGGGGGGQLSEYRNGYQGIVIVRYLIAA